MPSDGVDGNGVLDAQYFRKFQTTGAFWPRPTEN
jgi:hypothetical protein